MRKLFAMVLTTVLVGGWDRDRRRTGRQGRG
jgi:hypothetical protein